MRYPSSYLALIALLITYGSLYPFNLSPAPAGALHDFLSDTNLFSSIGDVLGNIGLYVPWGLVGILSIAPRNGIRSALLRTSGIGLLIALGLQIAQIWFPPRTPALSDAFWNMFGCGLGMALGNLMQARRHRFVRQPAARREAICLLAAWTMVEWLPLVPSLDFQLVKNHLKELLAAGPIVLGDFVEPMVVTLFLGELSSRFFKPYHSLFLLPALVALVLSGKFFIVDAQVSLSMGLGFAFGVMGWWAIYKLSPERRSALIVIALIAAYSIQALTPFDFKNEPSSFDWLPFAGLLEGSMLSNIRSLGQNLFIFTGILILFRSSGSSTAIASIGLGLWVLIIEIMQRFIETRSASITEPLLVLIIGYFLGLLAPTENHENVTTRAEATAAKPSRRQGLLTDCKTLAIGHLLTIIAMTGCLRILLKLPMIPYNIKELFRGDGSIPALFAFSMGLMWIGAGSVWLAHRLIQSRSPGLLLAPLTLAVSLISLALIWSGATSESITDIAGASNVFWFVTNKDMWGAFWRDVFLSLDAPEIIGLLETAIRYSMLYAPLTLCLGLMIYIRDRKPQCTHDRIETTGLAASALLFLWLCKAIAFDWTSTDNLNELIARDGEWGWGGGGYLYGLVFLLCMNSVLISGTSARSVFRIILAGLFSLVALPVAWWLLNQGLEQAVEKYDSVFSGVQFLLGPDRRSTLSQDVLLLRWCVVQVTGILVISSGIRLGKFLFPRPSSANH